MLAARPQDKTGLWTDAHFDAWWKRISTKSVFQHTPHSPQKFHSISALDFVRSVLNYVHQASIISDNTKCPIDQAKIQSVDCITQTFWDILLIASGDWMDLSSWYWYCGIYYVHSTAGRSIELPLPADCQTHSSSPKCAIARFSFSLPPSATYT